MKIKRDKATQALIESNPFDYLTSLKQNGRAAVVHDDIESMGKSAASTITSMDVDSEIDIAKAIRELVDSPIMLPKDMKIDDRDLPTAKNFYEWVTDDRFGTIGDERPFIEQLIWGLIGFNDVCYVCSDMDWLLHNHKVDDTYVKLERKVALLENGVCPHCKLGRSKAIQQDIMPFYNELAINAGQRCVIGSTPTITAAGLLHMDEFIANPTPGFQPFEFDVYNGNYLETTSQFFYAEPEPVVRVDTAMGFSVTGTYEHPIKCGADFVKLADIQIDDVIEIHYGQRVFGPRFDANARTKGANFYDTVLPLQIRTADEASIIAFLQGMFREKRRVFLGMSALRDVSALLLNAGYPHRIDGPCIILTDEVFEALKVDHYTFGTFEDRISSKTDVGNMATYDFTLPETHQFITGGILSHNSGKSHTVGTYLAPYHTHRLLKLQKPAQFYGLSRTTMLQGTFAALTYTQAKDTLWTPYYGALIESNWFKQYHGMLRHYENVYGERLFKLTDTFVDYRVRGLQYHPMGPDKRVMRGRCTRFSTIINTNGGFFAIGELVKKDGYRKVSGMEIDNHKGGSKVSHTYKDKSETIRVETRNGYHIEGTPEHPMLVLTPDLRFKWTPLDEMQEGDWIVSRTNKNNPMFGENRSVSKDMATIMGYYVANGNRNTISSSDDVVINNLYAKYKSVTGGHLPTFCVGENGVRSHTHYMGLGGTGVFVRDRLRPLGIKSSTSKDKEIPLSIRTAPFEIFHEFFEAYFECDSGVNGGGENGLGSTRPHEIEVGSASRKLARQLHVILLHAYGIVGRLSKQTFFDKLDKSTGLFNAKREHWIVSITGYDAMRFLNTFKRAKVQKYRDKFSNTPAGFMSDRRSVPHFRRFVYDTYENARMQDSSGKKLRTYVREDGSIYSTKKLGFARPEFIKNYRPTGPNSDIDSPLAEFAVYQDENWGEVLPILEQFSSERAERIRVLLEQGAHFEEVVKIKEKKKRVPVYDVTVPGTHAFTANGLVSHNTRCFFCYTGDSLVSTNAGLVRIDDETIVGKRSIRGSKTCNITNWKRSHFAKDVLKLKLYNGMEISVTAGHKMLSIGDDLRTKRVKAKNMEGRYIGVTLGGEFPKELTLENGEHVEASLSVTDQYVVRACELGSFKKSDLVESDLPVFKGINALLAKLINTECATKVHGGRSGSVYTIQESVSVCLESTRGQGKQAGRKYDFRAPAKMCERLAWILGVMVADGNYASDHEFTVSSVSLARMEKFCEYMHAVFNVNLSCSPYDTPDGESYWRVNMGTRHVKEYFRYLGLNKAKATTKEIPWAILQAPRACVVSYLNAAYTTDGGMHQNRIYYRTRSKKMAAQFQMVLARCGYASRLRKNMSSTGYVYDVRMYGESTGRFLNKDYDGTVKRDGQEDYRKLFTAHDRKCVEFSVPYTDGEFAVRKVDGRNVPESSDPNIIWVEVVDIEKCKPQWVYDIAVDSKDHMFTSNGVIASNSIDEIAYFDAEKDSGKVKINAYEVYDALANSLATVRTAADQLIERGKDDVLSAYAMNVSSPTAKNDMIHVLLERAKNSRAMYGIHRATWQVNPNFKCNSKFITEAYRKDPESAEKNFAANPPLISNPFLPNHDFIAAMEDTGRKNTLVLEPRFRNSKKAGQSYMYGEIIKCKKSAQASLLAIDAGLNDNSFSIVGGTTDGVNLNIDLVGEIIPLPGYRINHSLIYSEIILPIMKRRNVKILLADRWNSIKLLDDAKMDMSDDPSADDEINGFIAKQHSLKYLDMVAVKTRIEQGFVKIPKSEIKVKTLIDAKDSDYRDFYKNSPVAHLFKQMFTIRDLLKGVGKGDGYTDDNWRAMALCLWGLQEEDFLATLMAEPMDFSVTRPSAIGASKLGSGAGSVVGTSGGGVTMKNGAPLMIMSAGRSR